MNIAEKYFQEIDNVDYVLLDDICDRKITENTLDCVAWVFEDNSALARIVLDGKVSWRVAEELRIIIREKEPEISEA